MNNQNNHVTPYRNPLLHNTIYPQNGQHNSLHPFSITQSLIVSANAEGKGKWSAKQHLSYIQFLSENIQEMSNSLSRKTNKVFLQMSKKITTRTADQCRSHHQKILKYHQSVEDIINRYYTRINREVDQKKKLQSTRADEQSVQGFYNLKRVQNLFSLTILQSAIESFRL